MDSQQELTRVEALEGVDGRGGGQLEGQRGQDVLLPKDVRLALAQGQDLGGLVQVDVGVDYQGSNWLGIRALKPIGRLLQKALRLRLRLACSSSLCIPSHLQKCESFQRDATAISVSRRIMSDTGLLCTMPQLHF